MPAADISSPGTASLDQHSRPETSSSPRAENRRIRTAAKDRCTGRVCHRRF